MADLMDAEALGEAIDAGTFGVGKGADIFRMELLPEYGSPTDGGDYQRFLDGATEPSPEIIEAGLARFARRELAGITSRRVRVLSAEITPYELYSILFGYRYLHPHEDIRILHRGEHDVPPLLGFDYWWMSRTKKVVRMHYDDTGQFTGAEDASQVARQIRREERDAWAAAEPFDTWFSRHSELRRRLVV